PTVPVMQTAMLGQQAVYIRPVRGGGAMTRKIIHVVDDDASFRSATGHLLEVFDYEVVLFDSAESFLRNTSNARPDCLLLAVRAAGIDGLALQAEIQCRLEGLPIVFVSSQPDTR